MGIDCDKYGPSILGGLFRVSIGGMDLGRAKSFTWPKLDNPTVSAMPMSTVSWSSTLQIVGPRRPRKIAQRTKGKRKMQRHIREWSRMCEKQIAQAFGLSVDIVSRDAIYGLPR